MVTIERNVTQTSKLGFNSQFNASVLNYFALYNHKSSYRQYLYQMHTCMEQNVGGCHGNHGTKVSRCHCCIIEHAKSKGDTGLQNVIKFWDTLYKDTFGIRI